MLRCTIEIIPHGIDELARKIGIVEIGNDGTGTQQTGNYRCILRKTPPWSGALKAKWKDGVLQGMPEDADIITGTIEGFDRHKRGPYDLLFRALKACGLEKRNLSKI